MNNSGIINVFQKDLERGSEVSAWAKKMGYGSNKRYFYVETPDYEKNKKDGFRIFMRACCFKPSLIIQELVQEFRKASNA